MTSLDPTSWRACRRAVAVCAAVGYRRLVVPILLWMVCITVFAASPGVALQMVQTQGLGSNFAALATNAASASQSYRMMEARVTAPKAKALLAEHIQKVLPKYQPQWDRNLALSYAEVLSDAEMTSISREGRNSPYAGRLTASARDVGSRMQSRSGDLLTKAATEALSAALAASTP